MAALYLVNNINNIYLLFKVDTELISGRFQTNTQDLDSEDQEVKVDELTVKKRLSIWFISNGELSWQFHWLPCGLLPYISEYLNNE